MEVAKVIKGLDFGIEVHEERAVGDPFNDVVGHRYADQIKTEQDLEKIQLREVLHDEAATAARVSQLEEIFDGVLEVRSQGAPWLRSVFHSLYRDLLRRTSHAGFRPRTAPFN